MRPSRRTGARRRRRVRPLCLRRQTGRWGQSRPGPGRRMEEAVRPRGPWAGAEAAMKAVVESAGKVASRVGLGTHELVFDQPSNVAGGDDRGPSPLDVLAVSVA